VPPDRRLQDSAVRVTALTLFLGGLVIGPPLLLLTDAGALRLGEVRVQTQIAYVYWSVGAALMVAPFLALATVPGDWFERWYDAAIARALAIPARTFVAAGCVLAFALSAWFAWYSFDRAPTSSDEVAQLWHARMLLEGRLAMPPDPNPEFFAIDNMIDRPRWMSQFPIGGPVVMALGLATRAAWLLNPLLTALIVLNMYRFSQRTYGEGQARIVVLLLVTSPVLLLVGASYMNHTPTTWLLTAALAALPVWVSRGRGAAIIGVCIGSAIAIRPLDGTIGGVVIGLVMLWSAGRTPGRARSLLGGIAAGAVPLALLLAANWATNGHPMLFGYELLWGPNHSLGLHDDPSGNPHTALRAFLLAVKYIIQLNWIVTAWPLPVLFLVVTGLLAADTTNRWDAVLLGWFVAQLVAHALYWHDGQFVGPRFLFAAVPAVLVLAARAPVLLAQRAGRPTARWRMAVAIVPVCIGVAWLRPMKPFGVQATANELRATRSRFKVPPPREARSTSFGPALIFVQEGASTRLLHRLWGLGVSRADASRLVANADACSLVDAVEAETRRAATDTSERVHRLEQAIKPFSPSRRQVAVPDVSFRISDSASVTPACAAELVHDYRIKNVIAFGPMLLLNRFDSTGHVGGRVVYALDMGRHNEVLRSRFRDRKWYRYEVPRNRPDTLPILVPYDTAR
jgi:hypothetical protein